jgi:hypothetical protein
MAHLIICPNCGAPLPKQASQAAFAVCSYCRVTANVESRVVTQRVASPGDAYDATDDIWAQRGLARKSFELALKSESGPPPMPYARFRELCEQHLEVYGQTQAVARVAYNLALDFEAESGLQVRIGEALARFAIGYFSAVESLRAEANFEMNMPFIIATDDGPRHYSRTLDVPTLIALSDREPEEVRQSQQRSARQPATQAAPGPQPEPEPQLKRGFWSKLFG